MQRINTMEEELSSLRTRCIILDKVLAHFVRIAVDQTTKDKVIVEVSVGTDAERIGHESHDDPEPRMCQRQAQIVN